MPSRTLALLLLATLLAGCSSSDANAPIAIADFPAALAGAYCEYARHCTPAENDSPLVLAYMRASDQCASDFLRLSPQTAVPRLVEAVNQGTVSYDAQKARDCVNALASTCNLVFDVTAFGAGPCADAFRGTVATNGACHSNAECDGDAYCNFGEGQCPGHCVRRFEPGTQCNNSSECGAGAGAFGECVPDGATGMNHCVAVVEAPDAVSGESCGDAVDGNTLTRRACGSGLACPNGGGVCAAPHALGDACVIETDFACADGSLCLGIAGSATCRAVTVLGEVGDACDPSDSDLSSYRFCNPLRGLECVSGACARRGSGAEGSQCMTGGLLLSCDPGLVCSSSTSTCFAPAEVGATCYSDVECASGACDQSGTGATHTCLAVGCGA